MTSSNAAGHRPKQFGVTPPRSLEEPLEADRRSTENLQKFLVQSDLYKSKEEYSMQKEVLGRLDNIVKEWVNQLTSQRCDQKLEKANAVLFTFGSYHLEVDGPGTEIDTLCIGPNHVNREHDFFTVLYGKFVQMEEVTELQRVPEADIPLMKFKLCGVPINLLYASISLSTVPSDLDISKGSVLHNIDEATIRSLDGCRVSVQILELVPHVENFRTTLRCVKYWAKTRGICSNVTGFLGDADWALLVARICQAYPNASPSTLVTQFFSIFSTWKWPNPVMLCLIHQDVQFGFPVWDPFGNQRDRSDLMPIITPAYPFRNSRADVSICTLRVIKEHFQFGNRICQEIEMKKANWCDLFQPFKFFEAYKRYLHVDGIAENDKDLRILKRWVEPRLKQLISEIEKDGQLLCHPCSLEFTSRVSCSFFIGLSSERMIRNVNVVKEVPKEVLKEFKHQFDTWNVMGMELKLCDVQKCEIGKHTWGKPPLPVVLS